MEDALKTEGDVLRTDGGCTVNRWSIDRLLGIDGGCNEDRRRIDGLLEDRWKMFENRCRMY